MSTVKSRTTKAAPARIDESTKKMILRELLTSLAKNPKQTREETAKETIRIAKKCNAEKMAVAGVRANLTLGRYGASARTLIKQRRDQIKHKKTS